MNQTQPHDFPVSRRALLSRTATGFGSLALAGMLGHEAVANGGAPPAQQTHFAAKAKRVIFLFMHGGPSAVDTFDHKPQLTKDHGKPMPFSKPRVQFAQTGNLLASPWAFRQHGESGLWVSDLFPEVAKHVDKLCVINSMYTDNVVHGDAVIELHTGSDVFARPSMGAWITYGLGSENENLPGYITLSPSYAHGGVTNWGSAFLPANHQGTPIGNDKTPIRDSTIRHIRNRLLPPAAQQAQLEFLRTTNEAHNAKRGDASLEARINSLELAFRMQSEAPGVMDITNETQATRAMYGLDDPATADFGLQCLLARRFSERGVRFMQCSHSYKWDQHAGLKADHEKNAREVDRPIAALLGDLKQRGLLDDTLVLWGGEFGRTPTAQGNDGRDHNPYGYTMWMAGGGLKSGLAYGATDDYGYYAVQDRVHVHDLHATMLHLLGLDHTRLTYQHAGRNFRLTDVHGNVLQKLIA